MNDGIYKSREKDHTGHFRKMMYENDEEMNKVIGNLDENVFIKQQQAELKKLKMTVKLITKTFKL